jgi:putative FmdB family regulatory protein
MPTYEYRCKACGEHVEVVQSFKDGPLTECAACRGPLRKVFGNIGITFKGSGFYKTDSRSDGRKGSSKSAEAQSGERKSGEAAATSTSSTEATGGSSGSSSSSGSSGSSTKSDGNSKTSSEPGGKGSTKSAVAAS